MDEDLFRNYFVKLYKSLSIMESEYMKLLSANERKGFTQFTKSIKDLASHYKVLREKVSSNQVEVKSCKRKVEQVATKMIYGVGTPVSSEQTCKVVPISLGGFFKFRQ